MTDNERITDADLVAQVAAHDPELAEKILARLRRLRLGRIVTPLLVAGDPPSPHPAMGAPIATNGGDVHPRQF